MPDRPCHFSELYTAEHRCGPAAVRVIIRYASGREERLEVCESCATYEEAFSLDNPRIACVILVRRDFPAPRS